MAENKDGQEKTEAASGKKLEEARDKGSVAKSQDVTAAALLLFGGLTVQVLGSNLFGDVSDYLRSMISSAPLVTFSDTEMIGRARDFFYYVGILLFPILASIATIAIVAEITQVGLHFSMKKFTSMKLGTMFNPIAGLKKLMLSSRSVFELGKSVLKLVILGAVVYLVLSSKADKILLLTSLPFSEFLSLVASTTFELLAKIGGVYALIAFGDYAFQKWKFKNDMMMTKQEVKDENKQSEGDLEAKQRIKSIGRSRLKKIMMSRIKEADVIITNPTHFAVALKYKQGSMAAPILIGKGVDFLAARIREEAALHNIPIVENPPLARALYASVDVDQEIPEKLFQAVAQVLAYVYQLKKKK